MTAPHSNAQRQADVAKALARLGSASADVIADASGYRRADVVTELHVLRSSGRARFEIVGGKAVWSACADGSAVRPCGRPRTMGVEGGRT